VNPIAGDLYLTTNKAFRMTQTLTEEVAQQLYIRFRMFQGEWFNDPTIGTPWFQSILGQKTPAGIVEQILKRVVTTCPGVASLLTFSFKPLSGRRAEVVFSCKLIDGKTLTSADFGPYIIGPGA